MGCESSHLSNSSPNPQIRISIVDQTFMKNENDSVRRDMLASNIMADYFISLDCFFDEFTKRYYNQVVTNV